MMNSLQTLLFCLLAVILNEIRKVVLPPFNFPLNVPTIPFYVTLFGPMLGMDQETIYKTFLFDKLEKSGAVAIYFASRWNILVTRPDYLQQVFRQDDVFVKSGNQKKIPYSILAEYTGDNVISACGDNWRLYRKIVTHSVQFPNLEPIKRNSDKLIKLIKERCGKNSIGITDLFQRYCLANIGEAVIGVDFRTLDRDDENTLHRQLSSIKKNIFRPLYMLFPILDMLPIPSRLSARKELKEFKKFYCKTLLNDCEQGNCRPESAATCLWASLNQKEITNAQFEDNAMILLIAGHENPQLLLTSLLYVISLRKYFQNEIHKLIG